MYTVYSSIVTLMQGKWAFYAGLRLRSNRTHGLHKDLRLHAENIANDQLIGQISARTAGWNIKRVT